MSFRYLVFALSVVLTSLHGTEPGVLDKLAANMAGAFSSAEQARADQNFQNTTLHIAKICADRADGPWLYAEQALSGALRHPYKQTVYQLAQRADGSVECNLYDLTDPIAFTGAWQKEALKNNLSPAELRLREGCTIILRPQADGSFKGITNGKGCASAIRGASYATTEITVSANQFVIWERGYNANDAQVWGSVHGGYVFKKTE